MDEKGAAAVHREQARRSGFIPGDDPPPASAITETIEQRQGTRAGARKDTLHRWVSLPAPHAPSTLLERRQPISRTQPDRPDTRGSPLARRRPPDAESDSRERTHRRTAICRTGRKRREAAGDESERNHRFLGDSD